MVESLRRFKITVYMDTNKRTVEKIFDLDDYEDLSDMLKDVDRLMACLENDDIFNCF